MCWNCLRPGVLGPLEKVRYPFRVSWDNGELVPEVMFVGFDILVVVVI